MPSATHATHATPCQAGQLECSVAGGRPTARVPSLALWPYWTGRRESPGGIRIGIWIGIGLEGFEVLGAGWPVCWRRTQSWPRWKMALARGRPVIAALIATTGSRERQLAITVPLTLLAVHWQSANDRRARGVARRASGRSVGRLHTQRNLRYRRANELRQVRDDGRVGLEASRASRGARTASRLPGKGPTPLTIFPGRAEDARRHWQKGDGSWKGRHSDGSARDTVVEGNLRAGGRDVMEKKGRAGGTGSSERCWRRWEHVRRRPV